jgi:hypothetical protein
VQKYVMQNINMSTFTEKEPLHTVYAQNKINKLHAKDKPRIKNKQARYTGLFKIISASWSLPLVS